MACSQQPLRNTDQHEKARQQEVKQVPHQRRKPEVGQVDAADLLHVLRLDRRLRYKQESKGAGQGGHTVHQVDGNGEARLSPKSRVRSFKILPHLKQLPFKSSNMMINRILLGANYF